MNESFQVIPVDAQALAGALAFADPNDLIDWTRLRDRCEKILSRAKNQAGTQNQDLTSVKSSCLRMLQFLDRVIDGQEADPKKALESVYQSMQAANFPEPAKDATMRRVRFVRYRD